MFLKSLEEYPLRPSQASWRLCRRCWSTRSDWIYEIKFDGYRAVALRSGNETRILSRNEKDLGGKFPEVKGAVAILDVEDAIIDYAR
jgi:hypothetical protein